MLDTISRDRISIGNHMNLSAIWELHELCIRRKVITQGEAGCNLFF